MSGLVGSSNVTVKILLRKKMIVDRELFYFVKQKRTRPFKRFYSRVVENSASEALQFLGSLLHVKLGVY